MGTLEAPVRRSRALLHDGGPFTGTPAPPFQVRDCEMIYLMGSLPPAAAKALLPAGLEPAAENFCVIGLYSAPNGWVITPFTAFYVGIAVEGHDAPDGTEALYHPIACYSGLAGEVFKREVNHLFDIGEPRFARNGDEVSAHVDLPSGGRVGAEVTIRPGTESYLAGSHRYLGTDENGRLRDWVVAFSTPWCFCDLKSLTIEFPPGHRMEPLMQYRLNWATLCHDKSMTFTAPRYSDGPGSTEYLESQAGLLDIFERLGRAAAVVDGAGRIRYLNRAAARVASVLTTGSRLRAADRAHEGALQQALGRAIQRNGNTLEPVPLASPDGSLFTQIVAIPPTIAGEDAALAVFVDPGRPGNGNALPMLQLLGLTPAEARLAAAVGAGKAPREAAAELAVTENTARSTLKVVFDKLRIGRQSELARIVARLE